MSGEIIFGPLDAPLLKLGEGEIKSVRGVMASSLSGQQMVADELRGLVAADGLACLPTYTPVRYYFDGLLVGKFFLSTVMPSAGLCEFIAVSAMGILEKQQHQGGMYTGQRFELVVREIVGDAFPVIIEPQLSTQLVYGWLPWQPRRESLHQAVLAMGATITRDADGDMVIGFPRVVTADTVPDGRVFSGGRIIEDEAPATRVEVTEHSFLPLVGGEVITLFDATGGSGGENIVKFREAPVHSLAASGSLQIVEANCNYAKVKGVGVLTGRRYRRRQRPARRGGRAWQPHRQWAGRQGRQTGPWRQGRKNPGL